MPQVPSAVASQSHCRTGPSSRFLRASSGGQVTRRPHVRGCRQGRTHGQRVPAALQQPASSPKLIWGGRGWPRSDLRRSCPAGLGCPSRRTEPDSPARSQSLVPGRTSPSFTAESSLHQGQPCCQRSPTSLISDTDRAGGSPKPRGVGGQKGRSRGKPQTSAERARLLLPRARGEEARGAQRGSRGWETTQGIWAPRLGLCFRCSFPQGRRETFCWVALFPVVGLFPVGFLMATFARRSPRAQMENKPKETQTDPPRGWGRQGTSTSPGVPPRARKEAAANCWAGN